MFDALTEADLAAAQALSDEAGWNQIAADWRRLLDLGPCLAGRAEGQLVATATAMSYGAEARWIGMVLVARAWRGRGFGTAMLRRIVGEAPAGLDATELGRPLYLGLGFADVAQIDRWVGGLAAGPAPTVERLAGLDAGTLAYDRAACGADRGPLLTHLTAEPEVTGWVARAGGRLVGLAWLRPGRARWHLGPVVCEDGGVLRSILARIGDHLEGAAVQVDSVRDPDRAAVLAGAGLRVERELTRMTRPVPRGMLMGPRVAAATAFEWG